MTQATANVNLTVLLTQVVPTYWDFKVKVYVKNPNTGGVDIAKLNECEVELIEVKDWMPDAHLAKEKTDKYGTVRIGVGAQYPSTVYKVEARHLTSGSHVGKRYECSENGDYVLLESYTVSDPD